MGSINVLPVLRLFHLLAPHERRGIAAVLREVAMCLEQTAALDERRDRPDCQRVEWLSSLPALVRSIMESDRIDYDEAARQIEDMHDVPRPTIDAWWQRAEKRRERERRGERDLLIVKLFTKGWPKATIARRVSLTPARVGQIVADANRCRPAGEAGAGQGGRGSAGRGSPGRMVRSVDRPTKSAG